MRDSNIIALAAMAFVTYIAFYLAVIAGIVWVVIYVLRSTGVLPA